MFPGWKSGFGSKGRTQWDGQGLTVENLNLIDDTGRVQLGRLIAGGQGGMRTRDTVSSARSVVNSAQIVRDIGISRDLVSSGGTGGIGVAFSVRLYLFEEDGSIKTIPRRTAEGCFKGDDALPAYAGTRQRVLEVLISNEDRRPQAIQHANGIYLEFDQDGRVHESVMEDLREVMNHAFPDLQDEGNVVSLSPRRERQIWEEKSRWKPTKAELDLIVADLARKPGQKSLPKVIGVALKRPALTYEAKAEIREIGSKLPTIGWGIGQLSEKALPGFIAEARRRAQAEPEEEFYWEATARLAERHRELKSLRRTGKGSWVAVFQLFRHTGPSSMEEIFVEHRDCNGEPAAIAALKDLVREHHDKVGPSVSIEARTMPALEWQLLNGKPF